MYIERVSAETITVSGTGNTAITAIILPATFTPVDGNFYDILLRTQVPSETDGTIVNLGNDNVTGSLLNQTGNYARARGLGWRKVLRVQYFADPSHYNLVAIRG